MPDGNKFGTLGDDSQSDRDPLGLIGWVLAHKYKITGYIGEGGFGEVYKGYRVGLEEQKVVIKILKRDRHAEWSQKEARILGTLDHPSICRIVDFIPKDRALVVQYIDGKNFDEVLKQSGVLPDDLFKRVAKVVLDALAFAHKQKIAHRDIKPSNIMLDRYGHIYIIDFGIAKKIGGTVTRTGLGAGWSFWTAAPERRHGRTGYNPFLSDIFEVGVTLYYLATKQWPFSDPENPDPRRWGHLADKPLSNKLMRILKKATDPSPDKRFQSIEEMATAMARVRTIRKSSKAKYLVAAVAIALAIVAGASQIDFVADYSNTLFDQLSQYTSPPSAVPEEGAVEKIGPTSADSVQEVVVSTEVEQDTVPSKPVSKKRKKVPPKLVDIKRVADEPKELIVQPNEPPPNPTLTVETIPADNVQLRIDDREVPTGGKTDLEIGQYMISVIHPEFPVYQAVVNLTVDTTVTYNLVDKTGTLRTTNISISTVPRIIGKDLRVWFNGRHSDFPDGRVMGIEKMEGKWLMAFQVVEQNGTPSTIGIDSLRVDSGPGGTIRSYQTSNALVDLSGATMEGLGRCKVVVFRSEE